MPDPALPPSRDMPDDCRLGGIVAAAVTPIDGDCRIDVPRLVAHTRWLLENGCDLVSLFGTTGEGPSFPVSDRLDATRAVIAAGVSPRRLVPAVMTASADEGRQMFRAFAAMGCRAALVMPPFFYTATDDGVFRFCTHVADGDDATAELPILLYHYPAMSGFGFSHGLIARLAAHFGSRLAGIKDSTGELDHTLGLIAAFPTLSVFTGTDLHLVQVLDAGGAGIIGGVPNVNARLLGARLAADAADGGRFDAQIATLFAEVVKTGGPMPIKSMVARVHKDALWAEGVPPLIPLAARDRDALIACLEATGLVQPA
ncbi:MAG: dihydrodipicolinate synthase family protein [Rhodobacteraceae bacterium]|jgi:4-hydroxy-tetrahydrodipicolinate synthase|nr:dihydrodipicolinate synthase family protein [Paracoccaceae bacterium]